MAFPQSEHHIHPAPRTTLIADRGDLVMHWRHTLLAAVAAVLAACGEPIPTAPRVSTAIADAARGSATDFTWRAPTVPTNPTTTGSFDATALSQLAIEICKLNSGQTACTGSLTARYTSSGSTRIQLDATRQEYWVGWRTSSSLSTGAFYRVRAFRNGIETGFIDVDVVSNTSSLGTVDRTRYVGVVRGATLDIRFRIEQPTAGALVRINEIESDQGTPGDWLELFNTGTTPIPLGGYQVRDNDDTHRYTIPAGTTIPAGGFLVINESVLGYGLGTADQARLFSPGGALLDAHAWTAPATVTIGRCPDGTGSLAATTAATKGTANQCTVVPPPPPPPPPPPAPTLEAWPGSSSVQTAGVVNVLGGNLSGLAYEASGSAAPGVLWAARNGPGTLYRLVWNGTTWGSDPANGWGSGRTVRYPNGTGNPDAEGVTFAGSASAGLYVATERNNDVSGTSRNSILRFNPAGTGALVATHEWNLTSDLPAVGSNTGLEAIAWVPDSYLVARGFHDEARNAPYNPTLYPDHGAGLFLVGVEANGRVYAYALNHVAGTFVRVASFASGFAGVMGLEFDRELNQLWVVCDDGCSGRSAIFEIDTRTGSATLGRFITTRLFARPTGMSNLNNEGFAVGSQAECVASTKTVFWADDAATSGHALRRGTVSCLPFSTP